MFVFLKIKFLYSKYRNFNLVVVGGGKKANCMDHVGTDQASIGISLLNPVLMKDLIVLKRVTHLLPPYT